MVANHPVNPDLAKHVESLIRPAVVLILLDDEPIQTGFLISGQGLVCTCHHGFHLKRYKTLNVLLNGRVFPATMVHSSQEQELTILKVESFDGANEVPLLLPISAEPPPATEHRSAALTLGYGGLETFGIPRLARMLTGELSITYQTNHQERFDIFLIGGGKGHSGSPVMDLQRLRVLGYVRASYDSNVKLNGDALTIRSVLALYPELEQEWQQACRRFDKKLAAHYRKSPFLLDVNHCPGDLVAGLVSEHVVDAFNNHRDKELFQENRYVPRAVEKQIMIFSKESTRNLLLLSGASGSGKTSVLLNLTRDFEREGNLPLLIRCSGLRVRDLPEHAFKALLPIEMYEAGRMGRLFARCRDRLWVLIFDGLNECADFTLEQFRETVMVLRGFSELSDVRLKVIFSLRTEFLREHLQSLFYWHGARQDEPDADLIHFFERDDRGQPYINVGRINATHYSNGKLELEEMYERYRRTGLRPASTFEQLSPSIIAMLDRPFVLDLLMRIYHGAEIPQRMGRSNLIRQVVDKTLKKAGLRSVRANQAAIYLSKLAMFAASSSTPGECLDSDLYHQDWHRGDDLEILLDGTPFLERVTVQRSFGDENIIRFSADWTLEFFIARNLWEWWRQNSVKTVAELLSEFHRLIPADADKVNLQHFFIALVFFAEWSATDDPSRFSFLVKIMNDSERKSLAKGFSRECLDFFRVTYGLDKPIPSSDGRSQTVLLDLLSFNGEHFGVTAGEGCLDYVDYLETIGEKRDALLNLDVLREAIKGNEELEARRNISLALSLYSRREIDGALQCASKVDPQRLPSGLRAKHAFVVGRSYQFKGEFDRAEAAYEIGRRESSVHAYRCEHQLVAFIPIIARSDFQSVLPQLDRILEDKSFELTPKQRTESMLLRATCLFRLGYYAKAEQPLTELIRLQTIQRHKQGLGLALRALAEFQYRRFEQKAARETVDKAIDSLEGSELSLASAFDTKALILALLGGDLDKARNLNEQSLELSREARHGANIRWFLQTNALLSALEGRVAASAELLEKAGAENPYEQLRKRFILLLANYCDGNTPDEIKTEIPRLQDGFHQLSLVWYPGVLSLMQIALAGAAPDERVVAGLFPKRTNVAGVLKSHLCARIFAVR